MAPDWSARGSFSLPIGQRQPGEEFIGFEDDDDDDYDEDVATKDAYDNDDRDNKDKNYNTNED